MTSKRAVATSSERSSLSPYSFYPCHALATLKATSTTTMCRDCDLEQLQAGTESILEELVVESWRGKWWTLRMLRRVEIEEEQLRCTMVDCRHSFLLDPNEQADRGRWEPESSPTSLSERSGRAWLSSLPSWRHQANGSREAPCPASLPTLEIPDCYKHFILLKLAASLIPHVKRLSLVQVTVAFTFSSYMLTP